MLYVATLSQEEESLLEDAVDLNLPKDPTIPDPPSDPVSSHSGSGNNPNLNPTDPPEDEDDRLSNISGLSEMSGSDWKPMAGPFSWVQRQMMSGANPRELLKDMLSCDTVIPGKDEYFISV